MDGADSKSAIVTGGAQGIGKAIALRLLEDGYQVVIGDIDDRAGRETVEEYASIGPTQFVETDVSAEEDVARLVSTCVQAFGRLDALVNNAGIANPNHPPIEELSLDAWDRVIGVNLTGQFLCSKHGAPHLRKSRGAIVNIASTRALMSEPNTEAYTASKGGVVALTHALAASFAPAVRVNCICPGWILTSEWQQSDRRSTPELRPQDHAQHLTGRAGYPDDIAALAAFLLGDDAGFITGQSFVSDGGMTKKMIYE